MTKQQEYVFLDVDDFDGPHKWMAICFLHARYPSREILHVQEFYVDRTRDIISNGEKREFWSRHSDALKYNLERGAGIPEAMAETNLCQYVNDLRTQTPHFFLVSDNPGFDVAVVDHILAKHGHPPLCQRPNGRYLQTLCAWSFRLVLTQLFRERSSALFQSASVQHFLGQNAKQQPYGSSKPRPKTRASGRRSS